MPGHSRKASRFKPILQLIRVKTMRLLLAKQCSCEFEQRDRVARTEFPEFEIFDAK